MNTIIADSLGRKYRFALTIVAGLVLGDQALVQPYVVRLTADAPRINVAGRQRMLSQRLAKAALGTAVEGGRARAYFDEMREVLGLWSDAHERLLRERPWPGHVEAEVREGLQALAPTFSRMRGAALRLIRAGESDPPDLDAMRDARAVILDDEAEYLRRMERVVGLFEREARGRVESLRWLSWTLTALTLATLAAIGRLILGPAARLIRRQVVELARAHDDLEARVAERTRELEEARERHLALVEQFSHAGRASTIGEMASALAHELNQPLGAIANYAEGCLIELAAPEPALVEIRSALERIRASTMRAGRIIGQVRRFVTRHGPAREPFEPNRVVEEVAEILALDARRRGVAVVLDLAPGLPLLHGDTVQIQQVLVNLGRNAFEAFDRPEAQPKEAKLIMRTRPAGDGGVEFAAMDNGEGIPADRLGRVFDAYYSTRAGGMGMGLAICRTIVEAHHGRFAVESEPGIGTTFRFLITADPDDHA